MKTRFLALLAIFLCLSITFSHGLAAGAVCAVAAGAAMTPMQPACFAITPFTLFAHALVPRLMFNADKGGGGGGSGTPSVADLTKQVADLTGEKQTLTTQLSEANTAKANLESQLTAEKLKVTDLTKQVGDITKDRDTQTAKVADLEKNAKSAEQRAQEISAANGVPPAAKEQAGKVAGNQSADDGALWEQYLKSNSTQRAEMRATKGDDLQRSAEAFDKRGKV